MAVRRAASTKRAASGRMKAPLEQLSIWQEDHPESMSSDVEPRQFEIVEEKGLNADGKKRRKANKRVKGLDGKPIRSKYRYSVESQADVAQIRQLHLVQPGNGSMRFEGLSTTVLDLQRRSRRVSRDLPLPSAVSPEWYLGAKFFSDRKLVESLKGCTRDKQMATCQRPRYARWGKCTQCTSKLGGDSCRFIDFRIFE